MWYICINAHDLSKVDFLLPRPITFSFFTEFPLMTDSILIHVWDDAWEMINIIAKHSRWHTIFSTVPNVIFHIPLTATESIWSRPWVCVRVSLLILLSKKLHVDLSFLITTKKSEINGIFLSESRDGFKNKRDHFSTYMYMYRNFISLKKGLCLVMSKINDADRKTPLTPSHSKCVLWFEPWGWI